MSGGAYLLRLHLARPVRVSAGRLGEYRLASGEYLYVGSARRGLEARVARHRRLCQEKRDVRRWHIDALLAHPHCRWLGVQHFLGGEECALSLALAAHPAIEAPWPGLGATDCRHGCPSHLYRVVGGQNSLYSNISNF